MYSCIMYTPMNDLTDRCCVVILMTQGGKIAKNSQKIHHIDIVELLFLRKNFVFSKVQCSSQVV